MSRFRSFSVAADAAALAVSEVPQTFLGFTLAEITGTAGAKVYFRAGDDATDPIITVVTLGANESVRDTFPEGIQVPGLFVDVVSGSVEGVVYYV